MIDRLVDRLADWPPASRRKAAVHLLVWSFLLGHVNIVGFVVGWLPHSVMDAITNYLSWLALTITALDLVISTDVRVQQEEG